MSTPALEHDGFRPTPATTCNQCGALVRALVHLIERDEGAGKSVMSAALAPKIPAFIGTFARLQTLPFTFVQAVS